MPGRASVAICRGDVCIGGVNYLSPGCTGQLVDLQITHPAAMSNVLMSIAVSGLYQAYLQLYATWRMESIRCFCEPGPPESRDVFRQ